MLDEESVTNASDGLHTWSSSDNATELLARPLGQQDGERGAFADAAVHRDAARVPVDDPFDEAESDACTVGLR